MTPDERARVAARQARMQIRVYHGFAEHERDDAAYWAAIPVAERVMEVWRLSEELWRLRVDVDFIGRAAFIRNKRATGRPQDLADIAALEP